MGKPTGFLEFERRQEAYQPVEMRLKHYSEFVHGLTGDAAQTQGARCMDCGIPFCNNGCPVNNLIPDWNDLVFRGDWKEAVVALHSTNNFPEFTGRVCPAPCEAACTLGINDDPVTIKSIELAIVERGFNEGWISPQPAANPTDKRVAIVGSGPAGLAAAQQLARQGHKVSVFEKNSRPGGLLRYGIPDFKLAKAAIDRRLQQMQAEGVEFRCNTLVGNSSDLPVGVCNDALELISTRQLQKEYDAIIIAGGAESPRDLPVAGRSLDGVYFALEFLIPQNKSVAGGPDNPINAKGKHVVVIGGGDTGSDCVGTSNRHGAASVTQLELMPMPPESEDKALTWPNWPYKLRTSSSHEEGCSREFAVATKSLVDNGKGAVKALRAVRLEWLDGKMQEAAGSEFEIPADLVFLAMGFVSPLSALLESFGVDADERGAVRASTEGASSYASNVEGIFAAGDVRRGQSLVVWAIREGRQCARAVDAYLMGSSMLPR